MAWDDEEDESPSVLAPKSKWDDEEDSDEPILDSWDADSSDEEGGSKASVPAPQPKKKIPLSQKIAEREAAKKAELEEKRKQLLEAETPDQRRARLRQIEIEADLDNAADLFGDVSIDDVGRPAAASSAASVEDGSEASSTRQSTPAAAAVESVPLAEIDIAKLPLFASAKTKTDLEALSNKLSETLTAQLQKNPNYTVTFLPQLFKSLVGPLNSEQVRKLASSLTAVSNEKLKEEKAAENPKKSKKKGKPALSAASAKIDDNIDTTNYSKYDEFDDFM
ncbi:eukaryotic translation initiation factor 3 subunit J [Myxozyma melibiosi]|uniref:Eukaryotic translation initiation factor 3 subunit J n=1 Tax=Myxozyma melibiosi TaxID=54550 RepID=A0ABR1F9J9_9ASCO